MPWRDSDGNYGYSLTTDDDGPTIHAWQDGNTGAWSVQIETPEGSDVAERMAVSLNYSDALGWTEE